MGDKMLRDILRTIKNFLLLLVIFLFVVMLVVKVRVYKIKKDIREIESKILALNKEIDVLNLEVTYLTRPERLKQMYRAISDVKSIDNKKIVSAEQIKDIKVLIPYYYAKKDSNNSIARK